MVSIRTLTVVGAMLCSTALASCAQSEPATNRPQPKTHTVIMEGMVFRPDVITVTSGDTIVWVNKDIVPHSATSAAAGFDSKAILANESWRYTVPEQKGDFDYICWFHPTTMTAKLQVRG
jgi:plastocyanin